MKIAVCFLFVVISCYLAKPVASFQSEACQGQRPAGGNCMMKCSSTCQQGHVSDLTCLKNAIYRDGPTTLRAMANFICAFHKCQASSDKRDLVAATKSLRAATQCSFEHLLGSIPLNEFVRNANMHIQYLIGAVLQCLNLLDIGSYTTPCGPLKILVNDFTKVFTLLGIPIIGEGAQHVTEMNGRMEMFKAIAKKNPELLGSVLVSILGQDGATANVLALVNSLVGIVNPNSLLGAVTNTVNNVLSAVTGSINRGSNGALFPNLADAPNNVVPLFGGSYEGLTEETEGSLARNFATNGGSSLSTNGLTGMGPMSGLAQAGTEGGGVRYVTTGGSIPGSYRNGGAVGASLSSLPGTLDLLKK